jgi:tripartite-type tricarboxylate transporter receptor subunit TctC
MKCYLTRRTALTGVGAAAVSTALVPAGIGQTAYPGSQSVRIIVPFAPGGTTDVTGRILADRLGAKWGTSVVVENVPGAGTNLGIERMVRAPADGSHIAIITPSVVTNPFLMAKMPYDPVADLLPLSLTVRIPNLLVVKKDLPVNSVAEFIAYLKANPGKLNYASPGVGSTIHLSGEIFKNATGTEMTHVGYRGSGPALNDLVAGQVDLMFGDIPTVISLVRGGQLKALGVTMAQRYSLAPEFPAISETVPGFDVYSFFGAAVRAGTPTEIARKIEADCIAATKETSVRDKLAALTAETVGSSAQEFTAFLAAERVKWGKLITELNIKIP